jgi:hypothetical protein
MLGGFMAYCCLNAATYENKPVIGNAQCAVLVEMLACAPITAHWRKGRYVRRSFDITTGTAIATFDATGKYPNRPTGNHAALYLSQDPMGIWVIEQYVGLEKIQKRHIRFMNGGIPFHNNVANDADAYSVIEL